MTQSDIALEQEAMRRYRESVGADNGSWRAAFRTAFFQAVQHELTERQHDALRLYYLEGLSQRQIAQRWNITPSAVSRHLHRARARLRRLLDYNLVYRTLSFEH